MKRLFLTYLLVYIVGNGFAQNNLKRTIGIYERPYLGTYAPKGFGSSVNAFGLLNTASTVLSANQELNTIVFTNRQSSTWKPTGFNSGWVYTKWTSDLGLSWDSLYIQYDTSTVLRGRYPSGVILNQSGNIDLANAKIVASGTIINGANWIGNYFSSINMVQTNVQPDSSTYVAVTNSDTNFSINTNPSIIAQHMARNYFSSSGNIGHIEGILAASLTTNANNPTSVDWRGNTINKVELTSSGNVVWTMDSLKPLVHYDSTGKALCNDDAIMAWSKDGNTGYMVFYGIDSNATPGTSQYSFQPITYKTTDAGISWNRYCPLFDWNRTLLMEMDTFLLPIKGSSDIYRAFFTQEQGADATVDYNGDLHLLTQISSALSNNEDSLNLAYPTKYIFDVITKKDYVSGSDSYCIAFIDTLWSKPCGKSSNSQDCPWSDGSGTKFETNARLQISRSDDGKTLFYIWADTDTALANGYNAAPDIYIKGFDLYRCKLTKTYNVTNETSEGYWFYASDIALKSDSVYFIPLTISNNSTKDGGTIVYHSFIDNAFVTQLMFDQVVYDGSSFICDICPIGLKDIINNSHPLMLAPNPVSENSNLILRLSQDENITILISDIKGKVIQTLTYKGKTGENLIPINATIFNNGMYFFKVESFSINGSGKFVVQK